MTCFNIFNTFLRVLTFHNKNSCRLKIKASIKKDTVTSIDGHIEYLYVSSSMFSEMNSICGRCEGVRIDSCASDVSFSL